MNPAMLPYMPSAQVPVGTNVPQYDPWLEIHTGNLSWNITQIRQRVGDVPIMAVVKCNAYGHGTVGIAWELAKQGIEHFAVVKVQEAVALREHGVAGTVLNFGPFSPLEAEQIVQHDISQSVFSDRVEALAEAADKLNKHASVHIKVDTGLSRVGVPYGQAATYIQKIASMPRLRIDGVFTTLTEEDDFDLVQIERLKQTSQEAKQRGISVGIRHAASTDAVASYSASFLDMVRPGNCLYGFEPQANLDLKPVMALKTRVILLKQLRPGDTLSYHRQYRVSAEKLLAILPIGYADGYPFQAVNRAEVLIRGRRWPLIADITANHAVVDITGSEDIQIGDEVVLIGSQGEQHISMVEVATWANSSAYKVATGMSPFLPRFFVE